MKLIIENKNAELNRREIKDALLMVKDVLENLELDLDEHKEKDLFLTIDKSDKNTGILLDLTEKEINITYNIDENYENCFLRSNHEKGGKLFAKIEKWAEKRERKAREKCLVREMTEDKHFYRYGKKIIKDEESKNKK